MYQLRNGAYQKSGEPVKVLTVKNEIAIFFPNTTFHVEKSGTCIIFTSGADQTPTKKEVSDFNFPDR